jgi:hypothetical protein
LPSQISDLDFIFAQNYMLGAISCQTQSTRWWVRHREERLSGTEGSVDREIKFSRLLS